MEPRSYLIKKLTIGQSKRVRKKGKNPASVVALKYFATETFIVLTIQMFGQ